MSRWRTGENQNLYRIMDVKVPLQHATASVAACKIAFIIEIYP